MSELKPCPLPACSGEAQLFFGAFEGYAVRCTKCGITSNTWKDELLAAQFWNRLPREESALSTKLATARAALERIKHTMWICEMPLDVIDKIVREALEATK